MADNKRSVESSASPDAVWRIWSDTSTWPSWNPDVVLTTVDGEFKSGASGKMETKSGGKHDFVLENVEAGRQFDLVTRVPNLPATVLHFHCEVQPTGSGSTISQGITMTGPMGWLFGMMAAPQIAKTFPGLLQGLADAAEGKGG